MQVKSTYRNILQVAFPIIMGSLAQSLLNITDTAFLGRVDETTLAASALAGTYYLVFILLCMGLSVGGQIIIARRTGEGKTVEVGRVFDQGLYLQLIFGVFLFILTRLTAQPILKLVIQSDAIYIKTWEYLDIRSYGIIIVSVATALRAYYVGISSTRILTYTTFFMAVINGVLDYLLIFGKAGLPKMGIEGAALASLISEILGLAYFLFYTRYRHGFRDYKIFTFHRWNAEIVKDIIRLSYPTFFQSLISIVSWLAFFIFIEKLGEKELAISNVVRSDLLLFMHPLWGFSTAANTMVSNLLGQGKQKEIFPLIRKIVYLAFIWVIIIAPVIILRPEWALIIITNDPLIIQASLKPLYVISVALLIFVPGVIFIQALSGTGDTRTAFLIELVAISAYLFYTWLMTIVLKMNLEYVWMAEIVYWTIVLIFSYYRLRSGKWKGIKV